MKERACTTGKKTTTAARAKDEGGTRRTLALVALAGAAASLWTDCLPQGTGKGSQGSASCAHRFSAPSTVPTTVRAAQQLDLGDVGYCGNDPVSVRFSAGGRSVTLSAVSSSPLRVGVPIWIDPGGNVGNADLALSVVGPDGEHALARPLHVAALDPAGGALGDTTLAMIASIRAAVVRSQSTLSAFRGNTAPLAASLARMVTNLDTLSRAVTTARAGASVPIGTVSGSTIALDSASLAIVDSLFASFQADLLATATQPRSVGGNVGQISSGLDDAAWFNEMLHDVATGGLQRADKLASTMGTLLAGVGVVAALAGSTPALGALAVLGAVTYVATTFAPAATALVIESAALPVESSPPEPLSKDTWQRIQPALSYVVQQSVGQAVSMFVGAKVEPLGEVGAALVSLVDNSFGGSGAVGTEVSTLLFGKDASCADGVVPVEIGFKPDYVKCPAPTLPRVPGSSSGSSSSSSSSSSSGGGANPCFQGAGVAANPAPWVEACTKLDPRRPVPLDCLDESTTFPPVPAPTLKNGANPASVCAVFQNGDGAGTSLGPVTGCSHENGIKLTCYCCPTGS